MDECKSLNALACSDVPHCFQSVQLAFSYISLTVFRNFMSLSIKRFTAPSTTERPTRLSSAVFVGSITRHYLRSPLAIQLNEAMYIPLDKSVAVPIPCLRAGIGTGSQSFKSSPTVVLKLSIGGDVASIASPVCAGERSTRPLVKISTSPSTRLSKTRGVLSVIS